MLNSTNTTTWTSTPSNANFVQGEIVARSFIPGYVILSYFVSHLGAWTALELMSRRTATSGHYNWFLLVGSSFSIGGISIWSMHFIGNRAIVLGDDQPQLRIVYSPGFTVISFFMPVLVVLLAFALVCPKDRMTATRVMLGGALTGFAICGMHYLGQAGISNYECLYPIPFVVGAIIIAVAASTTALCVFFLFRLSWDTPWWRRPICAIVLASAVSGMHWIASVGTQYQLKMWGPSTASNLSRAYTVIVVLVLSICCCVVLVLTTFLAQWRLAKLAKRAQQVVLATAIFDYEDKILVTSEGYLPHKKITDSWIERSLDDVFSVSHPVFLWMFNTSRSWEAVVNLLPGMRNHVHRAGLKRRLGSKFEGNLQKETGTPIEDYSLIFRELFCVAAGDLAQDLHMPLENMGVLYDEIIVTGQQIMNEKKKRGAAPDIDLEGLSGSGKGQLLFLVKTVNRREADHLQTSGYCFAEPSNVIPRLATKLRAGPKSLTQRFNTMREYAGEERMLEPGIHLALFAIRAALGAGRHGFDLLARKDAKNLLPTMQLPIDTLDDWQLEYLKEMESMTMAKIMKKLVEASRRSPSNREKKFAKQFFDTIQAIKEESNDPIFNDAKLISEPIKAPCHGVSPDSPPGVATLITLRIIVPIHSRAPGKKLIYVPLNFFKMQQQLYKNAPDHDVFARKVYREFQSILDLEDPDTIADPTFASDPFGNGQKDEDEKGRKRGSTSASQHRPLKVKYFSRGRVDASSEANLMDTKHDDDPGNNHKAGAGSEAARRNTSTTSPRTSRNLENQGSGIELTQAEKNAQGGGAGVMATIEEEKQTYIDQMFAITVAKR